MRCVDVLRRPAIPRATWHRGNILTVCPASIMMGESTADVERRREAMSDVVRLYEGFELDSETSAAQRAMIARRKPNVAYVYHESAERAAGEAREWADKASDLQSKLDAIFRR
jgi:hypothetical protein